MATNAKSRSLYCLIFILTASVVTNIWFLVHFSNYKSHLVSDMGVYWSQAIMTFKGDIFSIDRWGYHPLLMIEYLSSLFKILAFFNLSQYQLEIALLFNIFFSAIASLFLFQISLLTLKKPFVALSLTFLYAFSYPILYFNTLVLTENLATPLLITVTYFILRQPTKHIHLFLLGVTFGIATGFRPNLTFIGLSFFFYLCFASQLSFRTVIRALIFLIGFFIIAFLIRVENNHISKGALRNISADGGYNFFHAQCKPYWIVNSYPEYPGGARVAGHPSSSMHQEYGVFFTDHPWHDETYFYKLGLECIKDTPNFWLEHSHFVITTFLKGFIFPDYGDIKYHRFFMSICEFIIVGGIASLGFMPFIMRDRQMPRKQMGVIISIPIILLATSFFFPIEMRYVLPSLFSIHIILFAVALHINKHKGQLIIYLIVLAIAGFSYQTCVNIHKTNLITTYNSSYVRTFSLESAISCNYMMPPITPLLFTTDKIITASKMELSAAPKQDYTIKFYLRDRFLHSFRVNYATGGGSKADGILPTFTLPEEIKGKPFDRILIQPIDGGNDYRICKITLK